MELLYWFSTDKSSDHSLPRYWFETTLRRITLGQCGCEPILVLFHPTTNPTNSTGIDSPKSSYRDSTSNEQSKNWKCGPLRMLKKHPSQ